MKLYVFALVASQLLLSACTPVSVKESTAAQSSLWEARKAQLLLVSDWDIKGRIGVVTSEDGWHADLRWQQQVDAYEIGLTGPFGQGSLRLYGDGQGVSLMVPKEGVVHAESAEKLLQENLGWSLPVDALRYWVRGLPATDMSGKYVFDELGRLTELHQNEWHILFTRYAKVAGLDLPSKIVLQRKDLKAKLIVSKWILPKAAD